ncbi:Spherulation-specific family 4 [Planctomycetes bacterium MalM25]|nr:Spherulation-specific family 4 [Planctomycetes bacterium MalM25]
MDPPRGGVIARLLTRLVALVAAVASADGAVAVDIVVPAYFFPSSSGSDWDRLDLAAAQVPITAIMNPNSGPGTGVISNYTDVVGSLRQAGGTVIGYVASGFGNRPLNDVLADIDAYAAWYDIDGIFIDEMSNSGASSTLDFYQAIYDHTKSVDAEWQLMGNPGTNTNEAYLTRPTADRLVVFETFGNQYPGHTPSAWNSNYDSDTFVNLLHTQSDEQTALDYVDTAVARNVGGVYFTDDVLGNPWDRLPAYWDAFVNKVAEVNNRVVGPLETLSNPVVDGVIVVDGARSDWAAIMPYGADATDDTISPLDIVSVTLANDSDELFVRLTLDATGESPPGLGSTHRVYLDVDNDRATGFIGDGGLFAVGADYLLLEDRLFAFQGATQETFSWDFLQDVLADDSTTDDLEWALPLAGIGDPASIDFLVQTNGVGGPDFLPDAGATGPVGNPFRYVVAAPPLAGDYDGDGDVDPDDYVVWTAGYGSAELAADGNGDGVVDAADYTVWRDAFTAQPAVSVPEPGALGAAVSMLLLCSHKRSAKTQPEALR